MAKLIRDNIAVEILKNNSGRVAILDDYDQMVGALNNKIIEETRKLEPVIPEDIRTLLEEIRGGKVIHMDGKDYQLVECKE